MGVGGWGGVPLGAGEGVPGGSGVAVAVGVVAGFGGVGVAPGEGKAGDVDVAVGVAVALGGGVPGEAVGDPGSGPPACAGVPGATVTAGCVGVPGVESGEGVAVGVTLVLAPASGAPEAGPGSPGSRGAPSPAAGSRFATAFDANRAIPSNVSIGVCPVAAPAPVVAATTRKAPAANCCTSARGRGPAPNQPSSHTARPLRCRPSTSMSNRAVIRAVAARSGPAS